MGQALRPGEAHIGDRWGSEPTQAPAKPPFAGALSGRYFRDISRGTNKGNR